MKYNAIDGAKARDKQTSKAKQNKANQTKTKQTKPNQTKPNQTKPNQTKPNQTKPTQTKPNQTKANQSKPNQSKPNQSKAKQSKAKQPNPNQTKPNQTNKVKKQDNYNSNSMTYLHPSCTNSPSQGTGSRASRTAGGRSLRRIRRSRTSTQQAPCAAQDEREHSPAGSPSLENLLVHLAHNSDFHGLATLSIRDSPLSLVRLISSHVVFVRSMWFRALFGEYDARHYHSLSTTKFTKFTKIDSHVMQHARPKFTIL
jgi:hypothetical protein